MPVVWSQMQEIAIYLLICVALILALHWSRDRESDDW